MPNRLRDARSPYLLQHADNPVDWWEWGDEAFAEARRRDVPVLPLWYQANMVLAKKGVGNINVNASGDWGFVKDLRVQQ